MKYRVRQPLLAILKGAETPATFLTIAPGSIINVEGEVQPSGFVEVAHAGRTVLVYMRDIENRAERVQGKGG